MRHAVATLLTLALSISPALISARHYLPLARPQLISSLAVRGGAKATTLQSLNARKDGKRRVRRGKTLTGKDSIGSIKGTKGAVDDAMKKYNKILPLTRRFMTSCIVMTVLSVLMGEAFPAVAAFDLSAILRGQIWRVFTGATFLGPPSMSLIMDFYYIFQHGSKLESSVGTSQFALFLVTQVAILGALASTIFPIPFLASSIVTAMLHVVSREEPLAPTKWMLFNIPSWTLPWAFALGDVLNNQSAASAIPHVMGILSGHAYVFHKHVNVKLGAPDWLTVSDKLKRKYDIDGADRVDDDEDGENTMEAIRRRRRRRR